MIPEVRNILCDRSVFFLISNVMLEKKKKGKIQVRVSELWIFDNKKTASKVLDAHSYKDSRITKATTTQNDPLHSISNVPCQTAFGPTLLREFAVSQSSPLCL